MQDNVQNKEKTAAEDDAHVRIFYSALRRWEAETAIFSDPDRIAGHPSFRRLVEMGDAAVPLIIAELAHAPSPLVHVIEEITGEAPYPESAAGDLRAMTKAWLHWSERKNAGLSKE